MIIFTEHNEVIMSVDDMRKLIRTVYNHAFNDRASHPGVPEPWAAERTVDMLEKRMRATQMI